MSEKALKKILSKRRKRNTTWVESAKFPLPLPRPNVVNHIGCSGGKDSTALLIWAIYESGYDRNSLDVSFCDTGNEAPATYAYLDYLEDSLQVGITRIKPELDFFALARSKKRFPSARARFCTEELKVIPTSDYIHHLESQTRTLVLHSGVRALESEARADLPPESFDASFGCWVKRPLLTWTISDVWAFHDKYGIKPNPLYSQGLARVGCFPCHMCVKKEVRKIVTLYPEVVERVKVEELKPVYGKNRDATTTFFHLGKVPLIQRSKEITTRDGRRLKVATMDDVARWSQTGKGGVNGDFFFEDIADQERLPMGETTRSCPSSLGMCE